LKLERPSTTISIFWQGKHAAVQQLVNIDQYICLVISAVSACPWPQRQSTCSLQSTYEKKLMFISWDYMILKYLLGYATARCFLISFFTNMFVKFESAVLSELWSRPVSTSVAA
jgi:hypothetical protein